MASIMPFRRPTPPAAPAALDVGFIAFLFANTDPDLHADHLDGETDEERAARQAAAADIADDLALEYGAETAGLYDDTDDVVFGAVMAA